MLAHQAAHSFALGAEHQGDVLAGVARGQAALGLAQIALGCGQGVCELLLLALGQIAMPLLAGTRVGLDFGRVRAVPFNPVAIPQSGAVGLLRVLKRLGL